MYKAILWDNDGVLVETEHWYYQATKLVMEEEGFNLTLEIYRETFLKYNTGAWHLLDNVDRHYIKKLRKKRNSIYSSYLNNKDIYKKDISRILHQLNNDYKMGIVTSSRKEHFDIIHSRINILKYFDFVISSEDYTNSKPNPEPYLIGIDKMGYKANECVAIEGSERGVSSAKKANLFCFAIPNQMSSGGNFSKADLVISNLNEVITYLSQENNNK